MGAVGWDTPQTLPIRLFYFGGLKYALAQALGK